MVNSFVAIVNVILFAITVSNWLLLVYRKAIDFCPLILYVVTLLNSLTHSNSVSIDFSRFFYVSGSVICK